MLDLGFTDRFGGVSRPSGSLNLGRTPGEDPDAVIANLALVASAFGVPRLATMRQVQGADVVEVGAAGADQPTCDALVTSEPGVALCVRAADCVPILFADLECGLVAVTHSGRRGMVAGVIPATIDALRDRGARQLDAWVGPFVCGGCYEVPAGMRRDVADAVPASFACTTWGTPSVDTGAGTRAQLVEAGCRIHDCSVCTRESTHLHSYRRNAEGSGRAGGVIVWRESGSKQETG